jgi:hypothetical protein
MRHSTGDNSQAIIQHSFIVHYHEFYFAFLLSVNETLLLPDIQSFSLDDMNVLLTHIEA